MPIPDGLHRDAQSPAAALPAKGAASELPPHPGDYPIISPRWARPRGRLGGALAIAEIPIMVDMAHSRFPSDLSQATHPRGFEGQLETVASDTLEHLRTYARENPGTAALWALGIGFVLGWKLKPW